MKECKSKNKKNFYDGMTTIIIETTVNAENLI